MQKTQHPIAPERWRSAYVWILCGKQPWELAICQCQHAHLLWSLLWSPSMRHFGIFPHHSWSHKHTLQLSLWFCYCLSFFLILSLDFFYNLALMNVLHRLCHTFLCLGYLSVGRCSCKGCLLLANAGHNGSLCHGELVIASLVASMAWKHLPWGDGSCFLAETWSCGIKCPWMVWEKVQCREPSALHAHLGHGRDPCNSTKCPQPTCPSNFLPLPTTSHMPNPLLAPPHN